MIPKKGLESKEHLKGLETNKEITVAVEIFVRKRRSFSERRVICQEDRKREATAFVSFVFKRKPAFSKATLGVVTLER